MNRPPTFSFIVCLALSGLAVLSVASTLMVPAAVAQESGFLGQMGEPIDTSAPIEIAADLLEVIQVESVAIFSGNVDATQGELRLQAEEVRVHYESSDGSGGEISRLDARGDVHVSTPRETARGDWAIYDVLEEQVTMGGNVVLTQGANVIRGDQLTIDLATGRSRIEGGPSMTSDENDDGRVRGIFTIPDQNSDPSPEETESDTPEDVETDAAE